MVVTIGSKTFFFLICVTEVRFKKFLFLLCFSISFSIFSASLFLKKYRVEVLWFVYL